MPAKAREQVLELMSQDPSRWHLYVSLHSFVLITPWLGIFARDVDEEYWNMECSLMISFIRNKPLHEGDLIFAKNIRLI